MCIWKTLQFWQAPKCATHLSLAIFNMSSLGAPVPNSLCNSCWNSWWMSCSFAIYEMLLHFLEPTISSHLPTKTGLTNQVLQEAEGQVFWVAWNEFFWNSHWSMGKAESDFSIREFILPSIFCQKGTCSTHLGLPVTIFRPLAIKSWFQVSTQILLRRSLQMIWHASLIIKAEAPLSMV